MPLLLTGLAYFCCAALALQLTRIDHGIAMVWLAGPLLFSVLTTTSRRHWLPVILACFPAGAVAIAAFGMGWTFALPLTVTGLAEAWGAAWLIKRLYPRFGRFRAIGEAGCFFAVTGIIMPALSALPGAWCAHLASGLPYSQAWRDWFTAHALGFITFAPPMLLLRAKARYASRPLHTREWFEWGFWLSGVVLASAITFGQNTVPLVMLPLIPMMGATLRLGRPGAVISIVILMVIGLVASLAGLGPTALLHGTMTVKLEVLQVYFASIVVILLPLAADLEARRRVMRQLRAAEALHRLIIDRTSDVTMRLALDGRIRFASPASTRILGYTPWALAGRIGYDLVDPQDRPALMEARQQALDHPDSTVAVEYRLKRGDGQLVWLESQMCATLDTAGQPDGTVTILRDVTERRQLMDDLSHKAMTDPLTGLSNRRAFDKALSDSVADSASIGSGGCLALFDLDHFKRINDDHGHATGDRMLVLFAAVLRGTVRSGDVSARLGGEEFAVLLKGATTEQARLVCERIRVRLASSEARAVSGESVRATVSVGLAALTPHTSVEDTMKAADAALYRAKHDGRNRLTIAA